MIRITETISINASTSVRSRKLRPRLRGGRAERQQAAAKRRQLEGKKQRSSVKKLRSRPQPE